MKKIITLLLVCVLSIFSLIGCGEKKIESKVFNEKIDNNQIVLIHIEREYNEDSDNHFILATAITNNGDKYILSNKIDGSSEIAKNINDPNFIILMMEYNMAKNKLSIYLIKDGTISLSELQLLGIYQEEIENHTEYVYHYSYESSNYKGFIFGVDYEDKDNCEIKAFLKQNCHKNFR